MKGTARQRSLLALLCPCLLAIAISTPAASFVRGDTDENGALEITDAVRVLGYLFLGSPPALHCVKAADSNDDGKVDISDGLYILGFLFAGGTHPPAPYPECGRDPSPDLLRCTSFARCPQADLPITVLGVTLLPDGTPATAASVTVASRFQGAADANGRFRVEGSVPEGARFAVLVRLQSELGALSVRVLGVEPLAAGVIDLGTLTLRAGAGVEFRGARVPVGSSPQGVATGDLQGDGNLDLVTANEGSDDFSVLLGVGDGSFREEVRYAAGDDPFGFALGDLQGDGVLDIVTANASSDDISVFLGALDGSFQQAVSHAAGKSPFGLVLGDLQGDGVLDVILSNWVLRGRGDGSFLDPVLHEAGGFRRAVLVDLQGDGVLDLVTSADVFLGRGDGSFQDQMYWAVSYTPSSVAIGDLQGDGALDIVTGHAISGDISVLLGGSSLHVPRTSW